MEGKVEGTRRRGRKSWIREVRELMGMGWAWRNAAERHNTASMAIHCRRCHSVATDRCQVKSMKVAIVLRNDKLYYEYVYKTV